MIISKKTVSLYQQNETNMSNLFAKAKQKAPSKPSKDEKVRISVDRPDFFEKVERLSILNDNMKRQKAEADMIHDEIKEISISEWVKLYQTTSKNPGTIVIESRDGLDVAQLQLVPSDKYISISEERATDLIETYGESIVEEETTYSFDAAMVDKYGEVISTLIENCDEISDRDKDKIIKAITKYTIKKGTIDLIPKYGEVSEVFEAIKPVVSLKNVEVIKS